MTARRVFAGLVAAWLVASGFLFLWPREDSPQRADAVVVLSGNRKSRLPRALELMRGDVAPTLVISNGFDPFWKQAKRLCARGTTSFGVVCFRPRPDSTQGEAEATARIARRRGWHSLVLVTSRFHVTRARMLFERCFDGRVQAVGTRSSTLYLPVNLVAEWGKLGYQLTVQREC